MIELIWGHGFTNTKAISRVDNIGAYLSAYLASVEINDKNDDEIFEAIYKSGWDFAIDEKEVIGDDGKKVSKKFVKGGRLYLSYTSAGGRGVANPTLPVLTLS